MKSLGFWAKGGRFKRRYKRRAKNLAKAGRFMANVQKRKYQRGYRQTRDFNERHDVIGLTPDHWISPIDFIPPLAMYNKGRRAYKLSKRAVRLTKAQTKAYKKSKKSRSRRSSSPSRRKGRGKKYYYYRGKRYSRK